MAPLGIQLDAVVVVVVALVVAEAVDMASVLSVIIVATDTRFVDSWMEFSSILALTDGYAMNVRQNGTVFWHDVIGFVDANWISVPTGLNFAPIVFKLHDQVPNS